MFHFHVHLLHILASLYERPAASRCLKPLWLLLYKSGRKEKKKKRSRVTLFFQDAIWYFLVDCCDDGFSLVF